MSVILSFPDKQPFSLYLERDAVPLAKERAGHRCELCGGTTYMGQVVCHHIFPLKGLPRSFNMFNHPSNLQVLCGSCHSKAHRSGRRKGSQIDPKSFEVLKPFVGKVLLATKILALCGYSPQTSLHDTRLRTRGWIEHAPEYGISPPRFRVLLGR